MLGHQNINIFSPNVICLIGLRRYFSIKEVKDTVAWICVIEELNDNTIRETFYEQNLQKTSQDKFKRKTVLNTKEIKYVSKWIQ